ncbi:MULTISPECIES: hypothetical protein [Sphingobacterium]|uniref:hypothetical protein n=1 Tax=Sphingobacterium TaxID=28453 RepID=UPI001052C79A|nr:MULTISPECIES: hypothetical protein [Sphingobacterium]MCW2258719.1 hypothetical protein [Sphingobacterium kitahiroshimense]TCR14825.1 hypothetical protein EDF67_101932 [Sphingobacterium sp. JUb78]
MKIKKGLCFTFLFLQFITLQVLTANGQSTSILVQQDSSIQSQTSINGHMVTGKIITIKYNTMSGNNPLKNQNWVGIWQGSQILYDSPPLHKAYILGTTSSGDFAFDSLSIQKNEYIIGLGNGSNTSTVSATLYFKAAAEFFEPGLSFCTTLEVLERGDNYLVVKFNTPLGNIPVKNKNWIGVWNGETFLSDCKNLIKKQTVNSTVSEDVIAINNLDLIRGTWYTITYGTGPAWTDIVASYTFINH